MAQWGKKKGIGILSTGDWTHPLWLREIRSQLDEAGEGLYKLKMQNAKVKSTSQKSKVDKEPLFLLSTEIASIYSQGEKLRRIHNLVFAPSFATAEKINKELVRRGCNLHSDGRPIIGLSSKDLLETLLSIDNSVMLIPCHVWTPHFGIYGSASGFDSLEEAFGEISQYVYGIETGLSSDPLMNWQMQELKNRSILSFSDAHSPAKMGREATVFTIQNSESRIQNDNSKFKISYNDIISAIKRDKNSNLKVGYTIEFYPEEGKYHFSGHRNCKVVFGPEEIQERGSLCPACKRQLTEGVLYRVSQLGDKDSSSVVEEIISPNRIKWFTDKTKNHPPYVKLVPLMEIVAEGLESTVSSQKVKAMFDNLCEEFGSEIEVLLKTPIDSIRKKVGSKIAEGIEKVRKGDIVIDPGFDGEYGKVKIWNDNKSETATQEDNAKMQLGLGF